MLQIFLVFHLTSSPFYCLSSSASEATNAALNSIESPSDRTPRWRPRARHIHRGSAVVSVSSEEPLSSQLRCVR